MTTQNVLLRIVALLLALADLAERAAGAPEARRRLVLAMLRSGEAATRDAFGAPARAAAHRQVQPAAAIAFSGDGPEDALALARSLRLLALIVRAIAASLSLSALLAVDARVSRSRPHHGRSAFPRRLPDTAFAAQSLDTS